MKKVDGSAARSSSHAAAAGDAAGDRVRASRVSERGCLLDVENVWVVAPGRPRHYAGHGLVVP